MKEKAGSTQCTKLYDFFARLADSSPIVKRQFTLKVWALGPAKGEIFQNIPKALRITHMQPKNRYVYFMHDMSLPLTMLLGEGPVQPMIL